MLVPLASRRASLFNFQRGLRYDNDDLFDVPRLDARLENIAELDHEPVPLFAGKLGSQIRVKCSSVGV